MGFPEWGTAPIKCAKRGCGWRGFETELDAEDCRQDMTTQSICPECGCHDYYFMTEKEVAKWERAVSDRLLEALKDARIDIEEWGAYAGDYFQEKWGLQEDLSRYDRLIAAVEAMRKEKPE